MEYKMMNEKQKKDIFTILYEVNGQQYVIGVTNTPVPEIATLGVNTPRPLPTNIRGALITVVKELKGIDQEPVFIDYNAPSVRVSKEMLCNFAINPLEGVERPSKNVSESLLELKAKMQEAMAEV